MFYNTKSELKNLYIIVNYIKSGGINIEKIFTSNYNPLMYYWYAYWSYQHIFHSRHS